MMSEESKKQKLRRRPLSVREILAWADEYRQSTGKWPIKESGVIVGTFGETWLGVDSALRAGVRGLPGGGSLAQLLAERRGKRNKKKLPPLTEEQVLAWADAHFERRGTWPSATSGFIPDSAREKWFNVDAALRFGYRGLPGGSSLAKLLSARRGFRNPNLRPPLSEEQILAWAWSYHARTGRWPNRSSGPIEEAPGDTWMAVDMALYQGHRGLAGRSSLALLLAERLGARNRWSKPPLTYEQILRWADAFHERTGRWPHYLSGPTEESGLTWGGVNSALRRGNRGLPGGRRSLRTGLFSVPAPLFAPASHQGFG